MNFLFFILLALFLIILQSIILPSLSCVFLCSDFCILIIIYLSQLYSHYGMFALIAFIGLIMDSISECPFFTHIFSYVWIYLLSQLIKKFVFKESVFFLMLISMMAVLIEQGIILFAIISSDFGKISKTVYLIILQQTMWAVIIFPIFLVLIDSLRQGWLSWWHKLQKNFMEKYKADG